MKKYFAPCTVLIRLATGLSSSGIASEKAAGGLLYLSSDSEKFTSRRIGAEFFGQYAHLDGKLGLRYTDYLFEQNNWSRQGQQLSVMSHQIDKVTRDGWMIDAGLFRQGSRELVTFDTSYRKTVDPQAAVEIFANRDYVETANALNAGTSYYFAGASADYIINPKLTAVGLLGQQTFSDGNRRNHARTRLIYQPSLDLGLTLQIRYRYFDSSKADIGGTYFNPERYDEGMLAGSWRKRAGNWRNSLTVGAGSQQINSDGRTATNLLEAGTERQEKNYALRLRGGFIRSAGFGGPDYRYRYVTTELIVPF